MLAPMFKFLLGVGLGVLVYKYLRPEAIRPLTVRKGTDVLARGTIYLTPDQLREKIVEYEVTQKAGKLDVSFLPVGSLQLEGLSSHMLGEPEEV